MDDTEPTAKDYVHWMATVLFTGFPGFLGVQLLPRVLDRRPDDRAVCIVQSKFADLAATSLDRLVAADPSMEGRVDLVEGDITRRDLGLGGAHDIARDLSEVWHLAAIYDLSVQREPAMAVNVAGTRNVVELAERSDHLSRFHYVSTCYVSGRHVGPFGEDDLDVGQRFSNFYEETKYLAEVEVQEHRDAGMPTTIYRPAVVVGDSSTGETQKYDGPYYMLQLLLRQWNWAIMPRIGDPTQYRFNMVPRDFVIDAIDALSRSEESLGLVYQLADPRPLTVAELYDTMAGAIGCRMVKVPVPSPLARFALDHVPGVEQLLRLPSSTVGYLTHPTHYLTDNQADLARSGVSCPPVPSYMGALVDFMRANPTISPAAMR